MGKPIIGITGNFRNEEGQCTLALGYYKSIVLAGGIPVIISDQSTKPYLCHPSSVRLQSRLSTEKCTCAWNICQQQEIINSENRGINMQYIQSIG